MSLLSMTKIRTSRARHCRMNDSLLIDSSEYEEREVVFGEEDEGKRLDAALAGRLPELSRNRIQSILESGNVSPAGLGKKTRVKRGDRVAIIINGRIPLTAAPEQIEIDVVYEDDDVAVVDKARGMVVHPGIGNTSGTLVNALLGRYALPENGKAVLNNEAMLSRINGGGRPGIVHRLDKNTSGLLVIAKTDAAHAGLAEQFAAHSVTRRYTAIAIGGIREDEGIVDAAIGRDPKNRLKKAVTPDGKRAVTRFRVLERLSGRNGAFTLLELELETGRTHQIRVHMASLGFPILGDDVYGHGRGFAAGEGQYLHAGILGFDHPGSGLRMVFESSLPEYFANMLDRLRSL